MSRIGTSYSLAFAPDNSLIATVGQSVWVRRVPTGKKIHRSHPFSHPSSACFSPLGDSIAVKNTSGQIAILDVRTGAVKRDFQNCLDGEGARITYSPCGNFIVDATWEGRIVLRDVQSGRVEFEEEFPDEMIVAQHCIPARGLWVFLHSPIATTPDRPPPNCYFSIWRWPFSRANTRLCNFSSPFVYASALSPDGSKLALLHGAPPDTLSIISLENGALLVERTSIPVIASVSLAWSPDGEFLAMTMGSGAAAYGVSSLAKLWDLPLEYACEVAFSSDGRYLAIGSWKEGVLVDLSRGLPPDLSSERRRTARRSTRIGS